MQVVIIEDEHRTADNLAETILRVEPGIHIKALLYSVGEAVHYFRQNEQPDLIFSDIQLGDGLSFEIFKTVSLSTPVVFCTAYNEYALNAFKANGIDYILKPFGRDTIVKALSRYKTLQRNFFRTNTGYELISELFVSKKDPQNISILVRKKDKIVPVHIHDIALFYIENEITQLVTFNREVYTLNKTLDELEEITSYHFYRANRQYLINRKAIKDATQWFHRKLIINLVPPFTTAEPITVSKVKAVEFINWLSGEALSPYVNIATLNKQVF